MGEVILRAENVAKVYRGRHRNEPVHALRGVSLDLEVGRTLGIVGESGCGKSTLARLFVGLESPTSGMIHLAGKALTPATRPKPRELAQLIQLVFQDPYSSLNPRLTVERTLAEVLRVLGLAEGDGARRRVLALLEMVALPERFAARYPHELSGGQAQRVAIARALAAEPRVLVLDEPTSALDVSVRAEVMNLLVRLQNELQLTYVFVSHDLAMVRHLSDEIAVMYLGRVVEDGPYQDVLDSPLHPYTRVLASAVPVADPDSAPTGAEPPRRDTTAAVTAPPETGCPYRPRCPLAIDVCATVRPPLLTMRYDHVAACHVAAQTTGVIPQQDTHAAEGEPQ